MKRTLLTTASPAITANLLAVGEETILRDAASSNGLPTTSGTLRLSYFTARKTESTTQVRILSGGTAAGATPTLTRLGLFSIDAAGNGTLVAATTSDTALLAAAGTAYTKAWASPYTKIAGQRYAVGILVVTGATAPTLIGLVYNTSSEGAIDPRTTGALTGQTDLPASFTVGSVAVSGSRFYAAVLP